MADDSAYDIMAQFWLPGRQPVRGESMLVLDKNDTLLQSEYKAASTSAYYSNFFEVSAFSFNMSNEPNQTGGRMVQGHAAASAHAAMASSSRGPSGSAHAAGGAAAAAAPAEDPFKRWRSATDDEARKVRWQLNFESFKLTRFLDGGSPIFFRLCGLQASFDKCSVVKRVSRGGNKLPQSFMRFDFTKVMLKNIEWSDGDLVTEEFTFVCDTFQFTYRKQNSDGELGPPIVSQLWDRAKHAKREADGAGSGS